MTVTSLGVWYTWKEKRVWQIECIISDFGTNSHLIKVSADRVTSMGVPSFIDARINTCTFGWQIAPRFQDIVSCFEASVFLRCFLRFPDEVLSCFASIAILWTILVNFQKVYWRNSEFVPSMAPIFSRSFSVWKYEVKIHYNVCLAWRVEKLNCWQPVKVLLTKREV